MLNVMLTASVSFLVSFIAIPAIIRVAREKKIFDVPDARKLHTMPIASLGGVGIFLGFLLSCLLTIAGKQNTDLQFFFAAAIVVFFIGLKDDILVISAVKKFLGQMAAAAILIHLGNVRLEGMHGFLGIHALPEPLSLLLSYVTIIVVINAYNLIDGVDGLAGSLGVLTSIVFGTYFLFAGKPVYASMAFGMAGSLLAFLIFNFSPAKIFMGDSGSLLLGLLNAILVIKFIRTADAPNAVFPLPSAVAIGFSILVVPLLDTLRVFSIRIVRGRSPFAPDRNHIHHLLLDRGLNHRYVTFSCVGLNLAFIAMTYVGRSLGSTVLILMMLAISTTFVGALMYFRKAKTTLVIATSFQHMGADGGSQPATKVVPIKNEAAVAEH